LEKTEKTGKNPLLGWKKPSFEWKKPPKFLPLNGLFPIILHTGKIPLTDASVLFAPSSDAGIGFLALSVEFLP